MESDTKKKNLNWRLIISSLLVLAGSLFILVPLIMTTINTSRNNDIIEEFLRESKQTVSSSESMDEAATENIVIPQDILLDESQAIPESALPEFNETPEPSEPAAEGAAPEPTKKPVMSKEEIKKRTIGVLMIPKIDVKILIMDGVDNKTLSVAAGRMPGTGKLDEIGNCVIAGHRSHTFGKFLNRLDEIVEGDEIYIQTNDKKLKYIAYKKLIIEPTDFSITKKNKTDKILTLFTCHPPGIGSHRLVVHAKQVE